MDAVQNLEIKCKNLENTVREYEQRLQIIMSNVPDIVYMLDAEGRILFISDSIKKYGYEPVELTGTYIMELIHTHDLTQDALRIRERRTGTRKTMAYEVRLITKDNTIVPFEIKSCDIENNPLFTITAEGYYCSSENDSRTFLGTVGVAREIGYFRYNDDSTYHDNVKNKADELLPICSNCKKIRDTEGKWKSFEEYFGEVYGIQFTHSICMNCIEILYPDYAEKLNH